MLHGEWRETLNEMFERYIRVLDTYRVKKCGSNKCNDSNCEDWHHDKEKRRSAWDECGKCNNLLENKTATSYTPLKFKTERCKCISCPFAKNCSFAHKGEPILSKRVTAPTRKKWVLETWEVFAIMESTMSNAPITSTEEFPTLAVSMDKRQKKEPSSLATPQVPSHTPRPQPVCKHTEPTIARFPFNIKTLKISDYQSNALSLYKGLEDTLKDLLEILCDHVQVKTSVIEYRARGMDYQLEKLARTRINCFLDDFGDEYETKHRVWCSSPNNQMSVVQAIDRDDQQSIFKFRARANAHASNVSGMMLIRVLRSSQDHEKATFNAVNNLLTYTSSHM